MLPCEDKQSFLAARCRRTHELGLQALGCGALCSVFRGTVNWTRGGRPRVSFQGVDHGLGEVVVTDLTDFQRFKAVVAEQLGPVHHDPLPKAVPLTQVRHDSVHLLPKDAVVADGLPHKHVNPRLVDRKKPGDRHGVMHGRHVLGGGLRDAAAAIQIGSPTRPALSIGIRTTRETSHERETRRP